MSDSATTTRRDPGGSADAAPGNGTETGPEPRADGAGHAPGAGRASGAWGRVARGVGELTVVLGRGLLRWTARGVLALAVIALLLGVTVAVAWQVWPFPTDRLDAMPASPAITDARGRILLRRLAPGQQWRLPVPLQHISPYLTQATVAVEDQRFYKHAGVDPVAVLRATGQNVLHGRVVSGASTLTMQVCRMMDNRPRTLWSKAVEAFRSLQLSRLRTKRDVLELYLNMAPYGGNLRGAEAAAWAYFGKHAADLSLAESALLAGIPQSPARLRPDRHADRARQRRDFVLQRMFEEGYITAEQRDLARAEPVALHPRARQIRAPEAAWLALARRPEGGRTTIDLELQREVLRLAREHRENLPAGSKVAVVVLNVRGSSLAAMVGSADRANPVNGQVNGALARRSPGSALKPLIYAAAFEAGRLAPDSTVYDVPIRRAGWEPENFDRTFRGPIAAGEALRRSLNVPAILVAENVGLDRCLGVIRAAGVNLPAGARARGGLAAAVGAIEVTLLDLTNAYATLARGGLRGRARLFVDEPRDLTRVLRANVCAAIGDVLSSRRRRPAGLDQYADSALPWFMWKTGTSAGRRDAWAVGHNTRYAIGVWVGTFRGTGRVEFVGCRAAEGLLAKLFDLPGVRQTTAPPRPKPIRVHHPIGPPSALASDLRILRPTRGDTFIAFDGRAIVHARANREQALTWFLNGRLLPADRPAGRMLLQPGTYELRCVAPGGQAAAVQFCVRR